MSFRQKLFGYVPSLEGQEEQTPAPADTQVTVPDDDEAQANEAAAQGEDNAAGQDQGTGEAPADTALDGEPGSETADDASLDGGSDDSAEEEDAVNPDEPIEYVDDKDLRVQEVADVEAAQREIEEEQDHKIETVSQAVSESKNLVGAIEALRELRVNNMEMGPAGFRHTQSTLVQARGRLGFTNPSQGVAMEALQGTRTRIAAEGFRQTLRTIMDAIIKFIADAIDWLKKTIASFAASAKRSQEETRMLTERLIAQRKNLKVDADKEFKLATDIDGLTVDGLLARYLTIGGQQPEDYSSAFVDVQAEVEQHRRFAKIFDDNFIAQIEDTFQAITTGKELDKTRNLTAPIAFIMGKHYEEVDQKDLSKLQLPSSVRPPFKAFASGIVLGNVSFVHFFGDKPHDSDLSAELNNLAGWTWQRHAATDSVFTKNTLRWLTTNEVKAGSVTINGIQDELMDLEKTAAKIADVQTKLLQLARRAQTALAPMKDSDEFFNDNNEEQGWRGPLLTELIGAIHGVVANAGRALQGYHVLGLTTCVAWNMYLKTLIQSHSQVKVQGKKKD